MVVEGLGGQAVGANRSPHAAAMAADLDHLGLQVTPENVVQVRNVLLGEAVRLGAAVSRYSRDLRVGECGTDPVSKPAMDGFNRKIESLKSDMQGYVDALTAAAEVLKRTAREYGHTESEIKNAFDQYAKARSPEWQGQLERLAAVQSVPRALRPLVEPPSEPVQASPLDMFRARR